jgi:hypothetical protein
MTLEEYRNLILLLLTFLGTSGAVAKYLLNQTVNRFTERFETHEKAEFINHEQLNKRLEGIENSNREEASQWQRMERELLILKADLPLHYVRREDYIRGQSVIEAKLDSLGIKFENAQLRDRRKPYAATPN